jgi:hypothetical protein
MKCIMRAPRSLHRPIGRPCIANESSRAIKKRKVVCNWAVVGIDLGTTNSAVAWAGPDGLQVIEHEDGDGGKRKYIPSVVGVTEVGMP